MPRRCSGWWFLLAASSCAGGPKMVRPTAEFAAKPPATLPAPNPPAVSSSTARREPSATSVSPPEPPLDPKNSFACGKRRCRAGVESCCSAGDVSVCAPNAPPRPSDATQLLGSQIDLCHAPPYGVDVDRIARCRSSANCRAGQVCCSQWMFSGASALICKPADGGEAACDFGEACTHDLPCRTPNTVCVKGTCSRSAQIRCGGVRCNLETHTCLTLNPNSKPKCIADSDPRMAVWRKEGRPLLKVTCLGRSDCLRGELCRYALGTTTCQRADYGTSAVMCDRPSDCPRDLCRGGPHGRTKVVCARASDSWHATCDCR